MPIHVSYSDTPPTLTVNKLKKLMKKYGKEHLEVFVSDKGPGKRFFGDIKRRRGTVFSKLVFIVKKAEVFIYIKTATKWGSSKAWYY